MHIRKYLREQTLTTNPNGIKMADSLLYNFLNHTEGLVVIMPILSGPKSNAGKLHKYNTSNHNTSKTFSVKKKETICDFTQIP